MGGTTLRGESRGDMVPLHSVGEDIYAAMKEVAQGSPASIVIVSESSLKISTMCDVIIVAGDGMKFSCRRKRPSLPAILFYSCLNNFG